MLALMVRLRVILPAAGAVAVLVLGCGGSDGGSAARATPTATTTQAPAEPTATATPAQRRRGVRLVRIGTFNAPVFVTAPRGDRRVQFVVEQGGRIMVVGYARKRGTPFQDNSGQVTTGGEQGLQ